MTRFVPGQLFKAPNAHVDVRRIYFDHVTTTAGLFGRDEGGATATKAIKDNASALRAIENRIGNKGNGL